MDVRALAEAVEQSGEYGYSCQTVLAKRVNELLHPNSYFCWFSIEFDPFRFGNSSNPVWLYRTLWQAVKTDDANDAKLQQIRVALMEAVTRNVPLSGNREAAETIIKIRHAPIGVFRPQIWRIRISSVESRISTSQYPHERKVEDLKWHEFDIIIE